MKTTLEIIEYLNNEIADIQTIQSLNEGRARGVYEDIGTSGMKLAYENVLKFIKS